MAINQRLPPFIRHIEQHVVAHGVASLRVLAALLGAAASFYVARDLS